MKYAGPYVPELSVTEDMIQLHESGELVWQVSVAELCAIGEYTTADGPLSDDWFLVFVGDSANWYEVPADAPTVKSVLAELRERLHSPLALTLVRSTSFASSTLWPPNLQGQAFVARSFENERGRLRRALGVRTAIYSLTQPIIDAINAH